MIAFPRALVAMVLGTLAAACAGTELRTAEDYDPGKTPRAQFLREAANCDKQAETDQKQLGYGPYDPYQTTYNRMFDACMRASGYARKSAP